MKKHSLLLVLALVITILLASCNFITTAPSKNVGGGTQNSTNNNDIPSTSDKETQDTEDPDGSDDVAGSDTPYENLASELAKFSSEGLIFELIESEAEGEDAYYVITGYEPTENDGVLPVSSSTHEHEPGYVLIPDTHEGHPVREIENNAFRGNKHIKKVYFMRNYRFNKIGKGAFKDCENLEDIRMPNNRHEIGDGAFEGCDSLKFSRYKNGIYLGDDENRFSTLVGFADYSVENFILHEDVYNISAIEDLTNLKFNEYENCYYVGTESNAYFALWKVIDNEVERCKIHENTKIVAASSFYGSNIDAAYIPDNVITIGDRAFSSCGNLSEVRVSSSVVSIGADAFANSSVETVSFDEKSNLTIIGDFVFSRCTRLKSINLPEGITEIPDGSFLDCTDLTEITIPDSITKIGTLAFCNAKKLYAVTISDNVTSIGFCAFSGCNNLVSLVLGKNVQNIGRGAFVCYSLVEVYNLSSIDTSTDEYKNSGIEGYAIDVHTSLDEVSKCRKTEDGYLFYEDDETCYLLGYVGDEVYLSLPESCNGKNYEIYKCAFYDEPGRRNRKFLEITIPDSVTKIGENAFRYCNYLKKITIGNSVTSIDNYAFYDCTSLASATIPDSVKSLGSAFGGCTSLTRIVFGNGIEHLNLREISRLPALLSITLGSGLKNIDDPIYADKLVEIINNSSLSIEDYILINYDVVTTVHSGESIIDNVDGYLFCAYDEINYLLGYVGDDTDLVLPESYNGESYVIHHRAFYGCDNITSVVITAGVTSIGKSAFEKCSNIKSVTISDSVTSIGLNAFLECSSLSKIIIPNSVATIDKMTFGYCKSLKSVTVGRGVTEITRRAFYNCFSLAEIVNLSSLDITYGQTEEYGRIAYYATSIRTDESRIFIVDGYSFISINGTNYLLGYSGDKTNLVLPDSYNGEKYEIYPYAFYKNDKIESVVFSDGVTKIGKSAFEECTSLKEIIIPGCVSTIDEGAFNRCTILTRLTISNGVKEIGSQAFNQCFNIESIIIPDSVTYIGDYAFYQCEKCPELVIGNGVRYIGDYAFSYTTNRIKYVTLPDSIEYLGISFSGHDKLVFTEYGNAYYLGNDTNPYLVLIEYIQNDDYLCTIHQDTKVIGGGAFESAVIKTLEIPKNVMSVGQNAFLSSAITKLSVLGIIANIGEDAFSFSYVGEIIVNDPAYTVIDGVLYSADCKKLIRYGAASTSTEFTVPIGVEEICSNAFMNCHNLTTVIIPDSVTSIGKNAFSGCENLASVSFGKNIKITSIDEYTFSNCDSLTSITIPESVTNIGYVAFGGCNGLTTITIPVSVTSIDEYAFQECRSITDVYYAGTEDEWVNLTQYLYWFENATIHYNYVPEE